MHVDVGTVVHRVVLKLDRLRPVSLLSVELTPIHRFNLHQVVSSLMLYSALATVGCGHDCLPSWVEAKVSLVHELLIKTRIDSRIVVRNGLVVGRGTGRIDLGRPILKQLVEDALLLFIVNVQAFALDCAVELMFALWIFVVVTG